MEYIIIGFILLFGYIFIFRSGIEWRYNSAGVNIVFGVMIVVGSVFFSFIVSGFILMLGQGCLKREEKPYATYELVALDTSDELHGAYSSAFFVGSGFIGEDLYYHYFYDTKNGIKYTKSSADNVFIKEGDVQPHLIKYGTFYKDTTSIFYSKSLLDETKIILYIPKGTIKRNFKIN